MRVLALGSVHTPARYKTISRILSELRPTVVVCTGLPNVACAAASYAEDNGIYIEWIMPAPVLSGSTHYDADGYGTDRALVERFNDQLIESSRRGGPYDLLAVYKRTTSGNMASQMTHPTLAGFDKTVRKCARESVVIAGDIWFPTTEVSRHTILIGV